MSPAAGVKPRPRHELVMRAVHPLVGPGVRLLSRLGLEPEQVVLTHGAIGLAAAAMVAAPGAGWWAAAAVLLQVKTVLDNLDGALARATGRVTELGRYLDTGVDLLVNAALFVALAAHGPWPLALLAFVVLTLLLSYDYNAERLHREAHGAPDAGQAAAAPATGDRPGTASAAAPVTAADAGWRAAALRAFRGLYRAVLAPQDAGVRALERRLFALAAGHDVGRAGPGELRLWWGVGSTAALVNLGLSTQYVVLGACLLLGAPFAYAWLVLAQGVYLGLVIAVRVVAFRRRSRVAAGAGGA